MTAFSNDALQFYPTTERQARIMAVKIPSGAESVLDPSAGEGALLKAVKNKFETSRHKKLYAIEIQENRQHSLIGQQFKLIGTDFLKFNDQNYKFDAIIMNPPFKNGIDHFLHAWKFLENDGTIICLLNSSSIEKVTDKGKLLKKILNDSQASVEVQNNIFSNADRKTDVETVLIVAKKPKGESNRYQFLQDEWQKELDAEKANLANLNGNENFGLVKHDIIKTLVSQYEMAKNSYASVMESYRKMFFYLPISLSDKTIKAPANYHDFLDELKEKCWDRVFKETKLANYMTKGMIEKFSQMQKVQGCREFSEDNIYRVLDIIFQNLKQIRESVVEETFDNLTMYYKENRTHTEGWKTNDSYKVNQKVILPNVFASWNWQYSFDSSFEQKLIDIEKSLCLMLGKNYQDLAREHSKWNNERYDPWHSSIYWAFHEKFNNSEKFNNVFGKWHDSEFFKVKVFKKGTMHLVFKDEKIWEMFNMTAAQAKRWLGHKTQNEKPVTE